MGFFKRAGRQVEQFKRSVTEAAAENATYRCEACDERFYSEHERCPECGDGAVVPIDSEE